MEIAPNSMEVPHVLAAGPIRLQRWTVDRAAELDQAINESLPELMAFMPWATSEHDLGATTSYLVRSHTEWDDGVNFNYCLLTPPGEVVGSCGLMSRRGQGVFEIGYWVRSGYAGRGYATAAARALAEVGLGRPGIERIEIYHDIDNPASGRVAAKAGFRQVGQIEVEKKAPGDSGTHLVWVRGAAVGRVS